MPQGDKAPRRGDTVVEEAARMDAMSREADERG